MTDAAFNVQQAVYNALANSATVQSLLGSPARVYDHVPPGAVFPYIAFGPLHLQPYDTKTETGFQHLLALNIWSRYRGSKETKDIVQAAYDALHRAVLTLTAGVFLSCEFHDADIMPDSDGVTYHASARFLVITQTT